MLKVMLSYFNFADWLVEVDAIDGISIDLVDPPSIWVLMYYIDKAVILLFTFIIIYLFIKRITKNWRKNL